MNRRGNFPDIHFELLGFQFRARKIMWVKADGRLFARHFQLAHSPKPLSDAGAGKIRSWALRGRGSDKSPD